MSQDEDRPGHRLVGEAMVAIAQTDDEHPRRGKGKEAWDLFNRALTAGVGDKDAACCKAWMGVMKRKELLEHPAAGDAILRGGLDTVPVAAEAARYFEEALQADRRAGGRHFEDPVQRGSAIDGHAAPLWVMHARYLAKTSGARSAIEFLEGRAALLSHHAGYYPPLLSLELGMQYVEVSDKASALRVWQLAASSDTAPFDDGTTGMIRKNIQVLSQPSAPPKSGCAGAVLLLALSGAAAVAMVIAAV